MTLLPVVSKEVADAVTDNFGSFSDSIIAKMKLENPVFAAAIEAYAKNARHATNKYVEEGIGLGAVLAYAILEGQLGVTQRLHAV